MVTLDQEIRRQLSAGKRIVIVDADRFPPEEPDAASIGREKLQRAQELERDARKAQSLADMLREKGNAEGFERQRARAQQLHDEARQLRREVMP